MKPRKQMVYLRLKFRSTDRYLNAKDLLAVAARLDLLPGVSVHDHGIGTKVIEISQLQARS